ncbi:hypothetical protein C5167_002584 [Papaver somniferum]|uniref:Protein kinase domain-containing protein n=1 Tax=Papaver somniferum TaxID=3469 RepID=A0A4Y7L1U6_PAPSO|nr:hypothetical protein C5167_002584 [Papaver somniferum]
MLSSGSLLILYNLQLLLFPVMIILFLSLSAAAGASPASTSISKAGCQEKCGNISIPYPFGIRSPNCYYDKAFEITCTNYLAGPTPFLQLNIELPSQVLELTPDYIRFTGWSLQNCYNKTSGKGEWPIKPTPYLAEDSPFFFSSTHSKLTGVGCDIFAYIPLENSKNYVSGCASFCAKSNVGKLKSCSGGNGCCQTDIPKGLKSFLIQVQSINTNNRSWINNPCSQAVVIDKTYSGNYLDGSIKSISNVTSVPMVLDWAIGTISCNEAKRNASSYACGDNSECFESDNGPGYRCNCSIGYKGNPYLGCQDIDECQENANKSILCQKGTTCKNTAGSYSCECPRGYHGDGRTVLGAVSCTRDSKTIPVVMVASLEELERATDNFNQNRIIGKGGFGTVYKGMLPNGRIVTIKKSKLVDENQVDQFINEVVILSQINHRHIVKLLGCCLETEVPLLVHEYVTNGALSYHLHGEDGHDSSISWKDRLRIASEIARALAYLHSEASIPIFRRDIKPENILLDENYKAKVSYFGLARSIPIDKTHVKTMVRGTLGYLDPEYYYSGQFTEKSDVYSFGVLLVELLTGQKVILATRTEQNLAFHFLISMKQNQLFDILEASVVNEGDKDEILVIAKLVKKCLKTNVRKRPTMKEVATSLDRFPKFQEPSTGDDHQEKSLAVRDCQNPISLTSGAFESQDTETDSYVLCGDSIEFESANSVTNALYANVAPDKSKVYADVAMLTESLELEHVLGKQHTSLVIL